jgi:UDPglucose 6-dehydrogenase
MAHSKLKVGIVGLGMVGEPIRKWFEERLGYKRGKELLCYDADLQKGYQDNVNKAEVVFVAVPTPSNPDGSCNTKIVEQVASEIKDGRIVVIKSTVPPGTVARLQKKYKRKHFIFNPEFLTESQAWEDFVSPDRQILGTTDESKTDAIEVLALLPQKSFIRPWTTPYTKRSLNSTEAEMGKYASNVFGYIKVVYANILADVAYLMGVDYNNIKEVLGADLRIGPGWLDVEHGSYAGAGAIAFLRT